MSPTNQSPASPPTPDGSGSSQIPASEMAKVVDGGGQEVKGEATDESPLKSILGIQEPMREEQVQNAVKFLSHPKVRGSPVIYRHSFLERKGLTKEEIDEAFRRVPDPPSSVTTVETTTSNQAIPPKSSTTLQQQVPSQVPQQTSAIASTATSLSQSRFHWSQALFVVGILSASGAGTAVLFKKKIVPKLKSWIRKVVTEENDLKKDKSKANIAEEAAEAAKAAASAASAVAKASQELLNAKNEERKYFEAFTRMLDVQVEEMKSMGNTIRKIETTRKELSEDGGVEEYMQSKSWKGTTNNPWRSPQVNQSSSNFTSASKVIWHPKENDSQDMDSGIVKPLSTPASVESTRPPHPKSYMEIVEMIQRGEKPPNIREIDDNPPNPDQPITQPLLAPKPKPWEVGQQAQQRPTYGLPSQGSSQGLNTEVNGNHSNGSEPWWRKRTTKISEVEPEAAEQFYDAMRANGISINRGWVPPQPPSVLMPEAADAIRQPKSSFHKQQQSGSENLTSTSTNGEDLDVRAPESNGKPEINGPEDQEREVIV